MRTSLPHRLLLAGTLPLALAAALAGGPLPAAAASPLAVSVGLEAVAAVHGLPATDRLALSHYGNNAKPGTVGIQIRRQSRKGHVAAQAWSVAGGTLSCTTKLTSCHLVSGDGMGAYGRLDLVFSPTGPVRTTRMTCAATGATWLRTSTRSGVLTGTLRLATHTAALGVIGNRSSAAHHVASRLPAIATRSAIVTDCPGGSGSAHSTCTAAFLLQSSKVDVGALRSHGTGTVSAYATLPSLEPAVTVAAGAYATGPGAAVMTIDSDPDPLLGATVTTPPNPFLQGSLTFASHGPLATEPDGCKAQSRPGTIDGTLKLTIPWLDPIIVDPSTGTLIHQTS